MHRDTNYIACLVRTFYLEPVWEMNNYLRMSETGRSYTQNFLKVQYVVIQAILRRKSMKKFIVTDEKYSDEYSDISMKNFIVTDEKYSVSFDRER